MVSITLVARSDLRATVRDFARLRCDFVATCAQPRATSSRDATASVRRETRLRDVVARRDFATRDFATSSRLCRYLRATIFARDLGTTSVRRDECYLPTPIRYSHSLSRVRLRLPASTHPEPASPHHPMCTGTPLPLTMCCFQTEPRLWVVPKNSMLACS